MERKGHRMKRLWVFFLIVVFMAPSVALGQNVIIRDADSPTQRLAIDSSGRITVTGTITAGGSGYSSPLSVAFSGGGGSGATATAARNGLFTGSITSITITNGDPLVPGAGGFFSLAPTYAASGFKYVIASNVPTTGVTGTLSNAVGVNFVSGYVKGGL